MASTWARTLPRATLARRDQPKPVTFIYPYYDNPQFLRRQVDWWLAYPRDLRSRLSVIVVDDGSQVPAIEVLCAVPRPCQIRLFRIHRDVRWNWLAARNIGAHMAAAGWLLLTDMDHVVPAETLRAVLYDQHDPDVIYVFSRREHTGEQVTPHSASFLMTKAMFWRVGGYDERLSGFYGTDGVWRRRCAATAPLQLLTDVLIRHELQGDASTTAYRRKQPEDARLKEVMASLPAGSPPLTLSFAYHEVTW